MIENECFICYTKSGKTIQERRMDNIHYKSLGYPLIQLSYAYGCNCKNMWAHNKCLRTIHKCPTCRKDVIKPQLQVAANIEKYIYLGLVKDNPSIADELSEKIKKQLLSAPVSFVLTDEIVEDTN